MEFAIADKFDNVLFEGISENAYQVRNAMLPYIPRLPTATDYESPHILHMPQGKKGLVLIWCSAEIPSLLAPSPRIINDSSRSNVITYSGNITLATLCAKYSLCPYKSRKLLRREYGVQGRKYCFCATEVPDILAIINPS